MLQALSNHSTPKSEGGRLRLDHLDGIRALAALCVLLGHTLRVFAAHQRGVLHVAELFFDHGHLAVDVFIVLSGYCLVLPVNRTGRVAGGTALEFYKRRCRRILPPLYAALGIGLVWSLIEAHWSSHMPGHLSRSAVLVNALLLQDIFPSRNVFDGSSWSVAVEWKIYFLLPAFIYITRRFGMPALLLVAAIIGFGLSKMIHHIAPGLWQGHLCPWYVFLFAIGVCAGFSPTRLASSPIDKPIVFGAVMVGLLAWLIFLFTKYPFGTTELAAPHFPLIDSVTGALAAGILIMCVQPAPWASVLRRLFSAPPLPFLGAFSYSLYLIHEPFLEMLRVLLDKARLQERLPGSAPLIGCILGVVLSLGVAYLFHLAVERPFMSKPAPRTDRQAEAAAIASPAP